MENEATRILTSKKIAFRLIRLSDRGISSDDVVKYAIDTVVQEEICKTIIVKDPNGSFYAVLLKGQDKIDFLKLKKIIGKKISIVSYEDVKKSTGVQPGAICPITLEMPIYIDSNVLTSKKINFGSGNHMFGLEIATADLERLFEYNKINVT